MQACWLVRNGVPFEQAFGDVGRLDEVEQQAMSIVFSTFEGSDFDWNSMTFKESK